MSAKKTDVLQGTLGLMVLKTLDVLGPLHGYGIVKRIEQISGGALTVTDLGSRNGTFVRVTVERVLKHSDYVFLGQQLLRVEIV